MHEWGPRLMRSAPVLGAALMLQGCLAAAIPVVAGGVIAGRDVVRESKEDASSPPIAASDDVIAASASAKPAADPSVTVGDTPAEADRDSPLESTPDWQVTQMTELPAPAGTSGQPDLLPGGDFTAFTTYVADQNAMLPGEVQSAMLSNPAALDGTRADCGIQPLAVLIDLDPADGSVPIEGTAKASSALANQLETLRRQDVTIGWISGRLTVDAERVRTQLAESGLDPLGEDTLLLMRTFGERKQQRRLEFGDDYCIVAIAGDTQSDFDELFDYLKDHSLAGRLDALRHAGWFITPLPLTTAADITE